MIFVSHDLAVVKSISDEVMVLKQGEIVEKSSAEEVFNNPKDEYTKNILEGLRWLGLEWDEKPIKQSDRISIHKSYIKKLLECDAAYRCFTTEDEISELREEQKKKGLPPKHDNRHRNLSKEEIETFISQGRTSE